MFIMNGFISLAAFINNTPGVVSAFGELSKIEATYTREMGIYSNTSSPGVTLHTFESKLDGVETPLNPTISDYILSMGSWLATRSVAGAFSDDEESCRLQLLAEFGSVLDFKGLGTMTQSGIFWMPAWVSFSYKDVADDTYKVWLSNAAFKAQYDGYIHLVVDPIDDIDMFHRAPSVIVPVIKGIRTPDITSRAKVIAGDKPYTTLFSKDYDWVDKNDPDNKWPVTWSVVIHGNAGINEDLIKISLQNHILSKSKFSRDEWEKIFPDIFLPTEFYLSPNWYRTAIPEGVVRRGMYSPSIKFKEMIPYSLKTMVGYPEEHLKEFLVVASSTYMSVGFLACGHPRNRNGVKDFSTMWPEYCNISTSNLDFNRLSPSTQGFIALLIRMFHTASTMDEFTDVPEGMTRIKRGEVWYLSASYEKVQYLVPWNSNGLTP
jgi:hypothetical protein